MQRSVDYIQNGLETTLANLLLAERKIEYTDTGISKFKGAILGYLAGLQVTAKPVLSPDVEVVVSAPRASAVSSADKTARVLRNLTATATLAGAVEHVIFNVTLSE